MRSNSRVHSVRPTLTRRSARSSESCYLDRPLGKRSAMSHLSLAQSFSSVARLTFCSPISIRLSEDLEIPSFLAKRYWGVSPRRPRHDRRPSPRASRGRRTRGRPHRRDDGALASHDGGPPRRRRAEARRRSRRGAERPGGRHARRARAGRCVGRSTRSRVAWKRRRSVARRAAAKIPSSSSPLRKSIRRALSESPVAAFTQRASPTSPPRRK